MMKHLLVIRTYLQYTSFYLLPIVLLVVSLGFNPGEEFYKALGSISLGLLVVIVFLTPAVQITKLKILQIVRGWRRELGVACFWFFVFHAAGLVYLKKLYDFAEYLSPQSYLFWGAIAGLGMLILGVTSNNYAVKLLKKHWKRVQFVAIPVFFFALAHTYMIDGGSILPAIGIFVLYVLARFFAKRLSKRTPRVASFL